MLYPIVTRIIAALLVVSALSGCVRRRLTVRTNPPGASVYVDKQPIGVSPASTSPIYYGTREIEVVRDGFRTEKILRTFTPPWYQIPPLDFISETLWPWEIRDERVVDITMVPEQPLVSEELQARADSLRLQAAQGFATPIPPTTGIEPTFSDAPIQPGFVPMQPDVGESVAPITDPAPIWRPGQILGNIIAPGGQAPRRIPEAGILPGGGYMPTISDAPQ